jgi:putative Mn2+ efflux pump MntP
VNSLDLLSVIVIAIGLSADCFAVSFGSAFFLKKFSWPPLLRLSLAFGFFQALMPFIGWALGSTFAAAVKPFAGWVAFVLLAFIGGRMLWEFFHEKGNEEKPQVDITRGPRLILLAVATSIDALAAGLSFAFLSVSIAVPVIVIGVTAFLITALGCILGSNTGKFLGKYAEIAGGIILIGIGLRILITSL